VTRSTLSISATGMTLVSTTPNRLNGTTRRPSISTTVRLSPRPRRFTVAPPLAPLLVPGPIEGIAPGTILRKSSAATGWVRAISSLLTVITGLLVVRPGIEMREPVTWMRSRVVAS